MTGGQDLYGAVDLGGTKLRAIVADLQGNVRGEDIRLSSTSEGLEAVLNRIEESLRSALTKAGVNIRQLKGVGIDSPGAVDTIHGIVPGAPQLPGWRNVPLVEIMERRLELPVWLENDATAAAFGEHRFGAGRGSRHMLYLTVSTGIGGGIVIDGELYDGASGAAGEFGHVTLDVNGPPCSCGSQGCLEMFASGTAIARRGEEIVARGESPALAALSKDEGRVTAEMMSRAAAQGDAASKRAYQEAGRYLGAGLAGFVNIFNPDLVLIGGGVARSGELIMEPARTTMRARTMSQPLKDVHLELAELGDLAGPLGMIARIAEIARKRGSGGLQ